jgi:hypothetical protein
MKRIDRTEAHRLLDAYLDAQERAATANDPASYARSREEAFANYQHLTALIGSELLGERIAAASIARKPFEVGSAWGAPAVEASRLPVKPIHPQMDRELAATQRRMVTRFLLDNENILPPGLALNFATAFTLANLGHTTRLTEPHKIAGLKAGSSEKVVAKLAIIARVYYLSGYRQQTLEQIILADEECLKGRITYDNVKWFIRTHKCRSIMDWARDAGMDDRLQGRPESPRLAADYDLDLLAELAGPPVTE